MLHLAKLTPDSETFAAIVESYLDRTIEADDKADLLSRYENGNIELWVCPNRGYVLLYVREHENGTREMVVLCVQGRGLYNADGIASINELAKREHCQTIVAYTKKPAVVRLLQRIGFVILRGILFTGEEMEYILQRKVSYV